MTEPQPRALEILLVEDSEDQQQLLEELFSESGMAVLHPIFGNGATGLAYLQAQAADPAGKLPSLVMLDLDTPGLNGFEVLAGMKADRSLRHIPVVFLTSSQSEADRTRAYAGGACSFITKPVGLERSATLMRLFASYWTSVVSLPPSRYPASELG